MKLFKKALAAVLLGAMALTMMTACWGWGAPAAGNSKTSQAVAAAGKGNALASESNKAMTGLQTASEAIDWDTVDLTKVDWQNPTSAESAAELGKLNNQLNTVRSEVETNLSGFTCASAAAENTAENDLYIWTNGKSNPTTGEAYPYLRKVDYQSHIAGPRLALLLSPDFVKLGEFKGTAQDYAILKDVLKDVEGDVGMTISKVYGMDVLLVTVPKTDRSHISQTPANQ